MSASATRRSARSPARADACSALTPRASPRRASSSAASRRRGVDSALTSDGQRQIGATGGDAGARRGEPHVDVGVAQMRLRQRLPVVAELAGGVHRGRANGGVAIVGGRAHRRQRRLRATGARQLHGGAQRDILILAAPEREQLLPDGIAAEAHQRSERGQAHAERRVVERERDVAERALVAEPRQSRQGLAAHAGVVVVEQRQKERPRIFRLELGDRRGHARTHAHVAIGRERDEPHLAVAERTDGVDGDDLARGVIPVEDGAQHLGGDRELLDQRHRRGRAHRRRRIAEARSEAAIERRIGDVGRDPRRMLAHRG